MEKQRNILTKKVLETGFMLNFGKTRIIMYLMPDKVISSDKRIFENNSKPILKYLKNSHLIRKKISN